MNTVNLLAAVDMLLALFDRGRVVSDLIKQAGAEGRDITEAELDTLAAETDIAIADARAAANRIQTAGGDGGG